MSKRLPHHEASSHTGLGDSIKGALRERAAVKGEHLFYIGQAVLVISCADYCYRHLGVKPWWSVVLHTRRIKDILPQLDRCVEPFGIAGVVHSGLHTLSLREAKMLCVCKLCDISETIDLFHRGHLDM